MPERRVEHTPWWEIRRAQNLKPATYRCPLCGERLPALSEHLLMLPEGRPAGRRHAHTDCVMAARRDGRLRTRAEWRRQRAQPGAGSGVGASGHPPARSATPWARLLRALRRHGSRSQEEQDSRG